MKTTALIFLALFAALAALSGLPRNLVVVEVATGTWCQYCPGAAMGCHDLLTNGHPVAIVKNHNGDSYANVYSNARNSFYGIPGYPTAFFDGVVSSVGGSGTTSMYTTYLPLVNTRLAVASHYTVNATGSNVDNQYQVEVVISKPEADSNTNVKLHAVITESNIPQIWFNQTTVEQVNRLMIPDQNGTAIALDTGGQTTVNLAFDLNPAWVPSNCELVLFLQNMTSKEILQGAKYPLTELAGGYPLSLTEHDFSLLPLGESAATPVTITNFANTAVSGTIAFDDPDFSSDAGVFSLPAFGTMTFEITFAPTESRDYEANLIISGDLWNYPLLEIPLTGVGYALLAEYGFAPSLGTYVPVTEGIVLGNESTRNAAIVDPDFPLGSSSIFTGPGFPIGFDFNFLGMAFDRLAIHSNGWISLGQSSLDPGVDLSSANYGTPIGSTVGIEPPRLVSRIAGLARYLQGQAGSELRLATIGTAPNRECVVQWTNFRRTNITGDSFNFQIRLQENGNKIQAVYGGFAFGNTNTVRMEVGLRSLPVDPASNFKNLSSSTGWSNPDIGTINTAYMDLSSTLYPASGTTYTWTPSGTALEQPVVVLSSSGSLSWQAVDGAGSYNIYQAASPDGEFSFVGSTSALGWTDPQFPSARSFYRVTAVSGN
ncbi:MAG: Omp28-related outer membrane protein [Candidatus Syntrophosphaera sp.]|nr:Omp28-related outer membrane protein [Candidatus Syntrophosphaera sp.]